MEDKKGIKVLQVMKGRWDDERGWIGLPLSWRDRPIWCKLGLHRWGAPWCMECGAPDHILQGAIRKQFSEMVEGGRTPEEAVEAFGKEELVEKAYIVAHGGIIDDQVVVTRIGTYSAPPEDLTANDSELNMLIHTCEAETFGEAIEKAEDYLNRVKQWSKPIQLILGKENV